MQQEGTGRVDGRKGLLKLLLGRICCVIGLLLSTAALSSPSWAQA
jgi:hypothetical protein